MTATGRSWLQGLGLKDDGVLAGFGLRCDQIARLRDMGMAEGGELSRMVARLGLAPETMSPSVRIDLGLNCAGCGERRLCRSWLVSGGNAGYRAFCPNGPMLDRMLQIQRWRGQGQRPAPGDGRIEIATSSIDTRNPGPSLCKRAYKLARSGECRSIGEIRGHLQREGYSEVDNLLAKASTVSDLSRILRAVDRM